MVGFEVKDDELQQSQDTQALVDAMVFDDGDDFGSYVFDGSYAMSKKIDEDEKVSVDDSSFANKVEK